MALAVTQWADTVLKAPLTRCIIEPGNGASIRVAEKAGYTEIDRVESGGAMVIVLERSAP